jgi:hypothetical protein
MYIPMDWLKNKENEKEIRSLLSNEGCLRFKDNIEEIESRLKELGEYKILEEARKGTFSS